MAEAARRTGYGHGSDVVRRLIARPIRLQTNATVPTTARPPATDGIAAAAFDGAPAPARSGDTDAILSDGMERYRTEVLLLKAVLQAERRENASLRACLGFAEAEAGVHPEARALRDRWAALLDKLLSAPA